MYVVKISDRDGAHFCADVFAVRALAGAFALRNSIGRERGAEVIHALTAKTGERVAEFFDGSEVELVRCQVPIYGDKIVAALRAAECTHGVPGGAHVGHCQRCIRELGDEHAMGRYEVDGEAAFGREE